MNKTRYMLLFATVAAALLFALLIKSWNPFGAPSNVIRWVTQSEEDVFGYDIYRGLSMQDSFTTINQQIIPGAGTTDLPQHYVYIDTEIEPEIIYLYYIESISLTGDRTRLTPIYSSKPKPSSIW